MESEESIYVNLEELNEISGKTEHQGPEEKKTKPEGTDSEAEEETETWSLLKVAAVCLGLLCFLLLTALIGVGVKYDKDFKQLSRDLANHTTEKRQLLARYHNLTDERDQLHTSLKEATVELNRMLKTIETCPDGWKKFGCSCYFLSATTGTWETSREKCSFQEAHLVIINSWEEMVFLNQLGDHLTFWIGLNKPVRSMWTWIDGKPPGTTYWKYREAWNRYIRSRYCAAFNSFQAGVSDRTAESWSSEFCSQYLRWVCEKESLPSSQNL